MGFCLAFLSESLNTLQIISSSTVKGKISRLLSLGFIFFSHLHLHNALLRATCLVLAGKISARKLWKTEPQWPLFFFFPSAV